MDGNNHYKFTREQVLLAYSLPVIDIVKAYGIELKDEGKAYRIPGNQGLFLFKNGLGFSHNSLQDKGSGIDFLVKYCGVETKGKAIEMVLAENGIYAEDSTKSFENKKAKIMLQAENQRLDATPVKKEFALPKRSPDVSRIYAYLLKTRRLDREIVSKLIAAKKVYQSEEYGNCVFVGDKDPITGDVKYAAQRGSTDKKFRGDVDGSDKSYAFHIGGKAESKTVYVLESAIEAISYASLIKFHGKGKIPWDNEHIIALGGCDDKALERFLSEHPNVKNIVFALNNDYNHRNKKTGEFENIGQLAARRLFDKYSEKGFSCKLHIPHLKDFNEDLTETMTGCKDLDKLCSQRFKTLENEQANDISIT